MIASLLFMGGLRRSEVSALEWRDVSDARDGDGVLLTVRTSKTNQEGDAADVRYLKNGAANAIRTVQALKRSPLGLDLYVWLVYRTFSIKAPLRLSWKQLYRQFGAEPNRASKVAQQAFRRDSLRELKKIKRAWPDLNYSTVTGGLVISPSSPRIPPAQLHLISE